MRYNFDAPFEMLDKINAEGFEAYFVGGAVRDFIMDKAFQDIDITTSAHPEEIKRIFSDCNVIDTGIKHGTVTVMYNNRPIEITTFRTELGYEDNRHPDKVVFCKNLSEDLKRRDFTVNSLCIDNKGEIIDIFGGIEDIKSNTLKAIGNAEERFKEDALRILRALRFASVLGFDIDKNTARAIHKCKDLILNVANERIASELRKMITGKNIRNILLEFSDVFSVVIPELAACVGFEQHNFHHKYDVYTHIATVVEASPEKDYIRLAALFHDIGKPLCFSLDENGIGHFYSHAVKSSEIAVNTLKKLRFDNETVNKVQLLVKQHDAYIDEDSKTLKRKLNRFGEQALRDLISLQRADTLGLADEYHKRLIHFSELEKVLDSIVENNNCFTVKNLDINGNDIIALGLKGKEIGDALNLLLEAVIDEKVENCKESLINYLKENS